MSRERVEERTGRLLAVRVERGALCTRRRSLMRELA
jgi:hypothetical protein